VRDQYSNSRNACENRDLTLGKTAKLGRQGSPLCRRTTDGSAMLKQLLHFLGQQATDFVVAVHIAAINADFRISGEIPDQTVLDTPAVHFLHASLDFRHKLLATEGVRRR